MNPSKIHGDGFKSEKEIGGEEFHLLDKKIYYSFERK